MKPYFVAALCAMMSLQLRAQTGSDTTRLYPVIKTYRWAAVYNVPNSAYKPDPRQQYKLLFDLMAGPKNAEDTSGFRDVNWGFGEVGRRLNLHVADGIPRENIDVVVVIHGFALSSMLNNEAYRKMYGVDNPTIPLINELRKSGVRMLVCGQAMRFMSVSPSDLLPQTAVSMSAQTVLTSHVMLGYYVQSIENED